MNGHYRLMFAISSVLFLLVCEPLAANQRPSPRKPVNAAVEALIAQLAGIGDADTGYSPYVSGTSFAPLNGSNQVDAFLISPAKPSVRSDAFRELVRLGAAAMPDLINHLGDARSTQLSIRHNYGGFGGFFVNKSHPIDDRKEYTLKVGDICYVALGQIVNRSYTAVRYQPTAIILVHAVTRDRDEQMELENRWGGADSQKPS